MLMKQENCNQNADKKYCNLVKFICQQRNKLYESNCEFKILDHSYNLWHQSHCPNKEKLRQLCLEVSRLQSETPLISIILPM